MVPDWKANGVWFSGLLPDRFPSAVDPKNWTSAEER